MNSTLKISQENYCKVRLKRMVQIPKKQSDLIYVQPQTNKRWEALFIYRDGLIVWVANRWAICFVIKYYYIITAIEFGFVPCVFN